MRTIAGILLAAALLLGFFGLVECFPGVYEQTLQRDVQRLSADGPPSEILLHLQTELRQIRENRIEVATARSLIAALLLYLGWVTAIRTLARPVEPFREGTITLPAKRPLLHLRRFSAALFGRTERIQSARAALRPKLETLFDRHAVKADSRTAG